MLFWVIYSNARIVVEPFLKKIACRSQWCHWFGSQGHLKVTKGHLKVILFINFDIFDAFLWVSDLLRHPVPRVFKINGQHYTSLESPD